MTTFPTSLGTSSAHTPLRATVEVLGTAVRPLPQRWRMESSSEVRALGIDRPTPR